MRRSLSPVSGKGFKGRLNGGRICMHGHVRKAKTSRHPSLPGDPTGPGSPLGKMSKFAVRCMYNVYTAHILRSEGKWLFFWNCVEQIFPKIKRSYSITSCLTRKLSQIKNDSYYAEGFKRMLFGRGGESYRSRAGDKSVYCVSCETIPILCLFLNAHGPAPGPCPVTAPLLPSAAGLRGCAARGR